MVPVRGNVDTRLRTSATATANWLGRRLAHTLLRDGGAELMDRNASLVHRSAVAPGGWALMWPGRTTV
jgi:hypothetical protein